MDNGIGGMNGPYETMREMRELETLTNMREGETMSGLGEMSQH